MPELPEVETVVRELRPHLVGRTIVHAAVYWARTIASPEGDAELFVRQVRGRRIDRVGRRGKFVLIYLDQECLVVHLRMSGQLLLDASGVESHLRVAFDLADGQRLHFYNQRKFGRIWLVDDPRQVVGDLGPEPLSEALTVQAFVDLFAGRRGMIKPLLLNQRFLAGLGNIYVDESLFRAGLHPRRTADTLTKEEMVELYEAIRHVLRQALDHHGTSFDGIFVRPEGERGRQQEGLCVYQQTGLPCVRCGTPIRRMTLGGRGTHFCPHCQQDK